MFFALKLIQSYGSGLRRAKEAMKANESPELEFRPADNNDDDYTQAIAYINREYLESLREDRTNKNGKYSNQENNQKTTRKIGNHAFRSYGCSSHQQHKSSCIPALTQFII